MKVERIDILPHARNPAGSYAIIKLIGVNRLDGPPIFSMEPVEAGLDGANWPGGDLKPLGVRAGQQSVELLIGPEIVRAGALKPGTQFRFRMPSADADLVLAWPHLGGDAGAPDASLNATTAVEPERGLARLNIKRATPGLVPSDRVENANERGAIASLQLQRSKQSSPPAPTSHANTGLQPSPLSPPPPMSKPDRLDGRSRHAPVDQGQSSSGQSMMLLPLALGFVIVAAMMVLFVRTTPVEAPGVTLFSALSQAIASQPNPDDADARPAAVLARIFETSEKSPAGVSAVDVTKRQALERANDLLASAKTNEQRLEAAFWLRKALAQSMSRPRLVWAVTQLGVAYASSDEQDKPNYEAAGLLWKWAAKAGDAKAACFLGKLYEQGLGVTANRQVARTHYERASSLGGCPGLKQAMSRVGN